MHAFLESKDQAEKKRVPQTAGCEDRRVKCGHGGDMSAVQVSAICRCSETHTFTCVNIDLCARLETRLYPLPAAGQMYEQSDVRSVHVYENQRWNPVTGYTDK